MFKDVRTPATPSRSPRIVLVALAVVVAGLVAASLWIAATAATAPDCTDQPVGTSRACYR